MQNNDRKSFNIIISCTWRQKTKQLYYLKEQEKKNLLLYNIVFFYFYYDLLQYLDLNCKHVLIIFLGQFKIEKFCQTTEVSLFHYLLKRHAYCDNKTVYKIFICEYEYACQVAIFRVVIIWILILYLVGLYIMSEFDIIIYICIVSRC